MLGRRACRDAEVKSTDVMSSLPTATLVKVGLSRRQNKIKKPQLKSCGFFVHLF